MNNGVVKWFNTSKGFGFIEQDSGPDCFVHFTNIVSGDEFRVLCDGDRVVFDIEETDKGLQALNVMVETA
jgi:CspA family cold shock protein